MMGNCTAGRWSRSNRVIINAYRGWPLKKITGYDGSTNPFQAADHNMMLIDCTYDVSANTFLTGTFDTDSAQGLKNNDKVYFGDYTTGGSHTTVPGNTSLGTEYFVINRSNPTSTTTQFQISLTQGGSAVDITGSNGTCVFNVDMLTADAGAGGATDPGGSGYHRIAHAGLMMHTVDGHSAATGTVADNADSFMSGVSWTGDPGFALSRAA